MDDRTLIRAAFAVRENAYTPYSHFKVGAALLGKSGKVYCGCNIENAACSPTIWAERAALSQAVSSGEREFEAIAVVGSLENQKNTLPTSPCGVCRQALFEFGGNDLRVILAKSEDDYQVCTLGDLLPIGLGHKNIEK